MDAVATERELLLKALIDSNGWEELKTNIQQINHHSIDDDDGHYFNYVAFAIKYLLLNKENFPSEILTLLIDKKITLIQIDMKLSWRHYGRSNDIFRDQIYRDICCLPFWTDDDDRSDFDSRISLPVFDMILQEHTRLVELSHFSEPYDHSDPKEWCKIYFIEDMWSRYLKRVGWVDGRGEREDVEDQLLSINNSIDADESYAELFHLWELTIRILEYKRQDDIPLLHHVVKEGYRPIFVWLLCKLQPNELQERDNTGRIPLHYSITQKVIGNYENKCLDNIWKSISKKKNISFYEGETYRDGLTSTSILLYFFKTGARYADSDGKLPLTCLLERGSWGGDCYDGDLILYRTHREDAKLLIDASPKEALTTRDISSGLFPFMIQSQESLEYFDESDESDCDRVEEIEEINLTVSYEILRQDPSVLLRIIDPDQPLGSSYEQRLRRQCDEEKEKNDQPLGSSYEQRLRRQCDEEKEKNAKLEKKILKLERREKKSAKLEKKILKLETKLSSKENENERLRKLLRQNNVVFDDKIGNNTNDDDDDDDDGLA